MKKRVILFVVIILLTFVITYGEYEYMKSTVEETPLTMVCFASRSLEIGCVISEADIEYKAIQRSDLEETYLTDQSDIVGCYSTSYIAKGAILQATQFSTIEELSMVSSSENILVTFEFDNETANAWNLRKNQRVQLLFCEDEGETTLYEDVIVFSIYDKNGDLKSNEELVPMQYVTFELQKDLGYELIEKREKGRVEIIVL